MRALDPASRDIAGGLIVIGLGGFIAWESSSYSIGTLSQMGPGFFPMWLGIGLAGLGLITLLQGLASVRSANAAASDEPEGMTISLRPLLAVAAGLLVFGLLLERLGLVPATVALVLIASLGERNYRPVTTVLTAVILAAASVSIFVYGFGMPIVPFRWGL